MTTLPEAVNKMIELVDIFSRFQDEEGDWLSGGATDGPNGDGTFPFTRPDGTIFWKPTVERLAAMLGTQFSAIMQSPAMRLSALGLVANGKPQLGVTPTDHSAAIEAVFQAVPGMHVFPVNYDIPSTSGGYMIGDSTIKVPRMVGFTGAGRVTQFFVNPNGKADFLFGLNTNGAGAWIQSYPGSASMEYRNIYLDGYAATAAGYHPCAFEVGGSVLLENMQVNGLSQFAKQIRQYVDQVKIARITYTQEEDGSGRFMTDLGWAGDGIILEQMHMSLKYGTTGDWPSYLLGRSIRLYGKVGSRVSESINGVHQFEACDGIETWGCHLEFGNFRLIGTSGTLRNHNIWKHDPNAPKLNVPPIYIGGIPNIDNVAPGVVKIEDVGIFIQVGFHGYTGAAEDQPDLYVDPGSRVPVEVERLYRKHRLNSLTPALGTKVGATSNIPWFNEYSHLTSGASSYKQQLLNFFGFLPAWPDSTPGVDALSSIVPEFGRWDLDSGTCELAVSYLYDAPRRIGLVGTNTKTFNVTKGAGAPLIVMTDALVCMVRIYMNLSGVPGQFDRYADVPLTAGGRLSVFGSNCMGVAFKDRTPGPVDELWSPTLLSYQIKPGERTPDSDAYGSVIVRGKSNTVPPTVGAARRGDRIEIEQPGNAFFRIGDKRAILRGWQRMTNCTEANPSHVIGTPGQTSGADWQPIYDIISNDRPGIVVNDEDFTLTPRVDAQVQRVSAGLTADRVVTLAPGKDGDRFEISRSGAANAYRLSIGGLFQLTQNAWCEVLFDNGNWKIVKSGTLQ